MEACKDKYYKTLPEFSRVFTFPAKPFFQILLIDKLLKFGIFFWLEKLYFVFRVRIDQAFRNFPREI